MCENFLASALLSIKLGLSRGHYDTSICEDIVTRELHKT